MCRYSYTSSWRYALAPEVRCEEAEGGSAHLPWDVDFTSTTATRTWCANEQMQTNATEQTTQFYFSNNSSSSPSSSSAALAPLTLGASPTFLSLPFPNLSTVLHVLPPFSFKLLVLPPIIAVSSSSPTSSAVGVAGSGNFDFSRLKVGRENFPLELLREIFCMKDSLPEKLPAPIRGEALELVSEALE